MLRFIRLMLLGLALGTSLQIFAEKSPAVILQELINHSHGTIRPATSTKHLVGLQFLDTEDNPIHPRISFPDAETASLLVFTTDKASITSIKIFTCCGAELSGTVTTTIASDLWRVDDMAFSNDKFRVEIRFKDGDVLVYRPADL